MSEQRNREQQPEAGTRLATFAKFFSSYMNVASIIAASTPIPVGSMKLIPAYSAQRGFLTVYSSLLCFLLLGFTFSTRHKLAGYLFSKSRFSSLVLAIPGIFILAASTCIFAYHYTLEESIAVIRQHAVTASSEEILNKLDLSQIPYDTRLSVFYIGIFALSEEAFILMALREYLQDLLRVDELTLCKLNGFDLLPSAPDRSDAT
jgi:hypothetical protein